MNTLNRNAIITSGIRGFICAGVATVITGLFSWSFVASTDSLNWMGSDALDVPAMAMTQDDTAGQPRLEVV